MLQPELSPNVGSFPPPLKYSEVCPPTKAAVPTPRDGIVVPVLVVSSGGLLLKFHCAMTTEFAFAPAATSRIVENQRSVLMSRVSLQIPNGSIGFCSGQRQDDHEANKLRSPEIRCVVSLSSGQISQGHSSVNKHETNLS